MLGPITFPVSATAMILGEEEVKQLWNASMEFEGRSTLGGVDVARFRSRVGASMAGGSSRNEPEKWLRVVIAWSRSAEVLVQDGEEVRLQLNDDSLR